MMRVTIIRADRTVAVDGRGFGGIDMSVLPETVHAVQWYGTHGDLELRDPVTGRMDNVGITSLDEFASILMAWERKREEADQSPPPSIVPGVVSARQVRLLLLNQGLLDDVEAVIAQQERATQIAWEYAVEFRRDDPLLKKLALQPPLSLNEAQLDQFFVAAAAL